MGVMSVDWNAHVKTHVKTTTHFIRKSNQVFIIIHGSTYLNKVPKTSGRKAASQHHKFFAITDNGIDVCFFYIRPSFYDKCTIECHLNFPKSLNMFLSHYKTKYPKVLT